MKCCMSTDVGTWTNWLTFELDLDHSPDAGTGLLSPISYRLRNFAALPRLPVSCADTQNFMLGKIPHGTPLEQAVVLKWFYSLSHRKTFVGGKCALLSAILVSIAVVQSTGHCRLLGCEEPSNVYISWIFVSTAVWLVGILAIRYTLKALLSYHGWMHEPRGKISLLTKLWLVVVLQLFLLQIGQSNLFFEK